MKRLIMKKNKCFCIKLTAHCNVVCKNLPIFAENYPNMQTISISSTAFNEAKEYATSHNLSVDEFVVKLI